MILQILLKKNKYEKDGSDFEDNISKIDKKIPDVGGLVKKTDFNTKVTEIEGKIPNVSNLVKKTDFNTKVTEIEGKIPDASNLVKNTDFDTRLKKISGRVTKNKSKHLLVENELKKLEKVDAAYLEVNVILMEMTEYKTH